MNLLILGPVVAAFPLHFICPYIGPFIEVLELRSCLFISLVYKPKILHCLIYLSTRPLSFFSLAVFTFLSVMTSLTLSPNCDGKSILASLFRGILCQLYAFPIIKSLFSPALSFASLLSYMPFNLSTFLLFSTISDCVMSPSPFCQGRILKVCWSHNCQHDLEHLSDCP